MAQFVAAADVALMTPQHLAAACAVIDLQARIDTIRFIETLEIQRLVPAAQRIRAHDRAVAAAMDDLVARALEQCPHIEIVVLAEPQLFIVASPCASRNARRITGLRKPISPRDAPRREMLPSTKRLQVEKARFARRNPARSVRPIRRCGHR